MRKPQKAQIYAGCIHKPLQLLAGQVRFRSQGMPMSVARVPTSSSVPKAGKAPGALLACAGVIYLCSEKTAISSLTEATLPIDHRIAQRARMPCLSGCRKCQCDSPPCSVTLLTKEWPPWKSTRLSRSACCNSAHRHAPSTYSNLHKRLELV